MILPDRNVEKEFLATLEKSRRRNPDEPVYLAGVDEVGRGALAGPASVGIALVSATTSDAFPEGLRDSKLLTPSARTRLVAPVQEWVAASAVGHSTVAEIDEFGIIGGLRAAALRAMETLTAQGFTIAGVLLDGSHDWWTPGGLFELGPALPRLPLHTQVKGDAQCAVIAAASVLAKVERDTLMDQLDEEVSGYDWAKNKGYSTPAHIAGLQKLGASVHHRTSWKLPGLAGRETSHPEARATVPDTSLADSAIKGE